MEAAKTVDCPIAPLPHTNTIEALKLHFSAKNSDSVWLWEQLADKYSVQTTRLTEYLDQMPFPAEILLCFNPWDEPTTFSISNSKKIGVLLDKCSLFEFYLTDVAYSFLVCQNHHDMLIACGLAKCWLIDINNSKTLNR